jgi:hypothetical protein
MRSRSVIRDSLFIKLLALQEYDIEGYLRTNIEDFKKQIFPLNENILHRILKETWAVSSTIDGSHIQNERINKFKHIVSLIFRKFPELGKELLMQRDLEDKKRCYLGYTPLEQAIHFELLDFIKIFLIGEFKEKPCFDYKIISPSKLSEINKLKLYLLQRYKADAQEQVEFLEKEIEEFFSTEKISDSVIGKQIISFNNQVIPYTDNRWTAIMNILVGEKQYGCLCLLSEEKSLRIDKEIEALFSLGKINNYIKFKQVDKALQILVNDGQINKLYSYMIYHIFQALSDAKEVEVFLQLLQYEDIRKNFNAARVFQLIEVLIENNQLEVIFDLLKCINLTYYIVELEHVKNVINLLFQYKKYNEIIEILKFKDVVGALNRPYINEIIYYFLQAQEYNKIIEMLKYEGLSEKIFDIYFQEINDWFVIVIKHFIQVEEYTKLYSLCNSQSLKSYFDVNSVIYEIIKQFLKLQKYKEIDDLLKVKELRMQLSYPYIYKIIKQFIKIGIKSDGFNFGIFEVADIRNKLTSRDIRKIIKQFIKLDIEDSAYFDFFEVADIRNKLTSRDIYKIIKQFMKFELYDEVVNIVLNNQDLRRRLNTGGFGNDVVNKYVLKIIKRFIKAEVYEQAYLMLTFKEVRENLLFYNIKTIVELFDMAGKKEEILEVLNSYPDLEDKLKQFLDTKMLVNNSLTDDTQASELQHAEEHQNENPMQALNIDEQREPIIDVLNVIEVSENKNFRYIKFTTTTIQAIYNICMNEIMYPFINIVLNIPNFIYIKTLELLQLQEGPTSNLQAR